MHEEERIGIRMALRKVPPSDRLDALKILEAEYNKLFQRAGMCGLALIFAIPFSIWFIKSVSVTIGISIATILILSLAAPPLIALTQKEKHKQRQLFIDNIREELKANDGLIDGA